VIPFPAGTENFRQIFQASSEKHPASCLSTGKSFHGDKVTGRVDGHSLSCGARDKNKSFTSIHRKSAWRTKGQICFFIFHVTVQVMYCSYVTCIITTIIQLCLYKHNFVLKVKNNYMFQLANVAIIGVNTNKIKRNTYSCN
jgi:hypothetical protein